jgi:hypothetical protein
MLQSSSPNHELVVSATVDVVRVRSSEDVVRDVASHIVNVVLPRDTCRHLLNLADRVAFVEDASSIGITLDVVLATGPLPLGAPCNARSHRAIEVCALRTRGGLVFAPKVVQNLVAICRMVGILGTKADLFLHGCCFLDRLGTCFNDWVGYSIFSLMSQDRNGILSAQLTMCSWHSQDSH